MASVNADLVAHEASFDGGNVFMKSSERTCSAKTRSYFYGKNVLLTGASGGLGEALALQFTQCGVKKLILSGRNAAALEDVAQKCIKFSSGSDKKESLITSVKVLPCDLSDIEATKRLGRDAVMCPPSPGLIDVLVNNGGLSSRSSFLDTTIETDETLMKVNFLSGAALSKIVAPGMIKQKKGTIIWISSVQGLVGIPNRSSYAASKFAVQGYCEALRAELASDGIKVHIVSPGYIRTNLSRSALKGDGSLYGKMDDATAEGMDPHEAAKKILDGVVKERSDITVAVTASARIAIWLKFLMPSFLQKMLVKRFDKTRDSKNKTD